MTNLKLLATSALSLALLTTSTLPAAARMVEVNAEARANLGVNGLGTTAGVKLDTAAKAKADAQIKARIAALTALKTRINEMKRVSVSQKASLTTTLDSAISAMTTLQAKIAADTDNATLKTDIQSITKSYRIYLLVLPQGRITAAADRALTTADLMTELSGKLQTRVTGLPTGTDTASMTASLTDMNAKIADAKLQANAAIDLVKDLKPDNGDKATFDSNQGALKNARAKVKAAIQDLEAARKDARSVAKALAKLNVNSSAKVNANAE